MLTCFKDLNFVDCFFFFIILRIALKRKLRVSSQIPSVEGKAGKKELAFSTAWEERKRRETGAMKGREQGA